MRVALLSRSLLTLFFLLLPLAATAADVTPVEILRNPTGFAGQSITLRGTLSSPRPGPMDVGPPVTVFSVMDSGAFVTAFTRFPLPCQIGSPVTVTGLFQPFRAIGRERLINVVEAFSVACQ